MSKLEWDKAGNRKYENGVDHGVLYTKKTVGDTTKWVGVAWDGLTSVAESPEGGDKTDLWADNIKYGSMRAYESFGGTIEAYTYPNEFAKCNGEVSLVEGVTIGQQDREMFRFSYRSNQGSDESDNIGYKIHLVYNATCSPSERTFETINDSPDAITFSWEFDTNPINVTGHKATSIVTIDTTKLSENALTALENVLYGTAEADAYMPDPDDIFDIITKATAP